MTMVWAVTMARNEADILGYTLSHLLSQDVDGIMVLDNNSTDETKEAVQGISREAAVPVILLVEPPGAGYYQSRKMTGLVNAAARQGAIYIIPFDADELWYSERGKVAELIRSTEGFISQAVPQYFHYCTPMDNLAENNPYKRVTYRTMEPRPWLKCCFKWQEGVRLGGGQHIVLDKKDDTLPRTHDLGIRIRHLPCRSFVQFADKIIRHGIAMDIQYPNDPNWGTDGPGHRSLYRGYQSQGFKYLEEVWNNGLASTNDLGFVLVKDPKAFDLINSPAPYTGTR